MIWLLIASLLWGPSFSLIPWLRDTHGMDSFTLGMLRMFYSMLIFLPLLRRQDMTRGLSLRLLLLGAVQFGVMYLTYLAAFAYMLPQEVLLCTVFTPLFVSLLCNCQEHTFCPVTFLLVVLAICGAAVIRWANPTSEHFWIGFGLMQLSNLSFALGQVGYRKLLAEREGFSDLHLFGWMYLGAFLVVLTAWLTRDVNASLHLMSGLPLSAWGVILWLGLIPSGVAFFLWNHGATRVNDGTLAIFNDLKIPIGLLIVFLLFGQDTANILWPRFSLGAGMMLCALVLNERWKRILARRNTPVVESEPVMM